MGFQELGALFKVPGIRMYVIGSTLGVSKISGPNIEPYYLGSYCKDTHERDPQSIVYGSSRFGAPYSWNPQIKA